MASAMLPKTMDNIIMETNSSSIVSKRSVERLYFPNEPHFFRYFVPKFQRRSPLINRGYWLRLRAIDVVLRRFITRPSTGKRVIINLGCGSDALPWQCHSRYGPACEGLLFIDIDFPDLILKKRAIVLQTPQLRELLGADFQANDFDPEGERVLLRSERYCQVGCDLRDLYDLYRSLETIFPFSGCEMLFVAEVSMTYMETRYADNLVNFASSLGQGEFWRAEFCLLEHLLPQGEGHPFAATMLSHLNKLNAPPRSVSRYPTCESQRARFQSKGWQQVDVWDLWQVWSSEYFLTSAERASLDEVEPFDEWEEFMLFARHYALVYASTSPIQEDERPPPTPTKASLAPCLFFRRGTHERPPPTPTKASLAPCLFFRRGTRRAQSMLGEVECYQTNAPKRRFGEAMVVSNAMGRQSVVHMMGLGSSGRADSSDVYSLGRHDDLPKLPLAGPPPRMCSTTTDLGECGVLLTGGRGSPANPFSDCWLFRKGPECHWQLTWSLPVPLFRHSAVRLRGTCLALIVGGKSVNSRISEHCFVFDPERGWRRCRVEGTGPRPTFGSVLCSSTQPGNVEGAFHGLLAGGITQDGRVCTEKYSWALHVAESQWTIKFKSIEPTLAQQIGETLSRFGARCVDLGSHTVVCGGLGQDPSVQGRDLVLVTMGEDGSYTAAPLRYRDGAACMPFMVGSCVVVYEDRLVIIGGGATCFSMGTYWETGVYSVTVRNSLRQTSSVRSASRGVTEVTCVESRRAVRCASRDSRSVGLPTAKASVTTIPRIRIGSQKSFDEILCDGKPVIIEGLGLGDCLRNWTSDYLVQKVGGNTEVVVHECRPDTSKMDFNSKNFAYVRDSFETVMTKMQAGGRLYLRSLSHEKPSEQPANLEKDFPRLAEDFCLPSELDYVSRNLFSSVLRVSGKVTMWLHYDVMANVYAQIVGRKRMILFPPSDVGHLSFEPGSSSSSLDVFTSLEMPCLAATRPHEAELGPGDVLFLPPLWLHTSEPTTDLSIAVNVFFRDLERGYAAGRDVYGNRDLAAYEKGRQDAARIAKGFQQLPLETRRFYLSRIADELRQAAEGG